MSERVGRPEDGVRRGRTELGEEKGGMGLVEVDSLVEEKNEGVGEIDEAVDEAEEPTAVRREVVVEVADGEVEEVDRMPFPVIR
jgi:hypothetical protein